MDEQYETVSSYTFRLLKNNLAAVNVKSHKYTENIQKW